MIKIFRVGEVDYIAARTEEQAIQCLADTCFDGKVDCQDMEHILDDGVVELSEGDLNDLKHTGEDGCQEAPYPRSFRAELDDMISKKMGFPCHFASTEI